MSEIDLIPADYARLQRLRRRLRRLLVTLVALAALILLARITLAMLLSAEKQEVARLQATKQLWQETKTKTERHRSEALVTEKQLTALDDLHGRDHLRQFLHALDTAYVDKVWFDEIRYYRREIVPAAPGSAPSPRPAERVEQRAGMVGHAMNHAMLAEFMKKLELQPAVAELALVDTSPRAYPQGLIIDFKLALLIDARKKGRE